MRDIFTVNGRGYRAKEFDYNMVCDLEKYDVSLATLANSPNALHRAYLAICGDMDLQAAGWEIEEHLIKYGELSEMNEVLFQKLDDSRLFTALSEKEEEEIWPKIRLIHSK